MVITNEQAPVIDSRLTLEERLGYFSLGACEISTDGVEPIQAEGLGRALIEATGMKYLDDAVVEILERNEAEHYEAVQKVLESFIA